MSDKQFIVVHTALPTHRRAGISFGRGFTFIPADQVSEDIVKRLDSDPHLRVDICDEAAAKQRIELGNARILNLKPVVPEKPEIDPELVRQAVESLNLPESEKPKAKDVNAALKKLNAGFTVKVADIDAALSTETTAQ